jgi:hypothetical protein
MIGISIFGSWECALGSASLLSSRLSDIIAHPVLSITPSQRPRNILHVQQRQSGSCVNCPHHHRLTGAVATKVKLGCHLCLRRRCLGEQTEFDQARYPDAPCPPEHVLSVPPLPGVLPTTPPAPTPLPPARAPSAPVTNNGASSVYRRQHQTLGCNTGHTAGNYTSHRTSLG